MSEFKKGDRFIGLILETDLADPNLPDGIVFRDQMPDSTPFNFKPVDPGWKAAYEAFELPPEIALAPCPEAYRPCYNKFAYWNPFNKCFHCHVCGAVTLEGKGND